MPIVSSKQIHEKRPEPSSKSTVKQSLIGEFQMGPAYFVIAILGCGDGGTACTPVTTLQTHYATEAECTAATGAALINNSQLDFPTLLARCRPGEIKSAAAQKPAADKRRRG
jgi:hypothetical protein